MKIFAATDYDDMSRQGANIICAQVILNPSSVLGLATGSTPVGMYKEMARRNSAGDVDFCMVRTANLDEYVGISPEKEQSYIRFMKDNLFDHININPENINIPNGMAEDIEAECVRYDAKISELGGIDMQLLGIGHNGHIGFNEPNDEFVLNTNKITLTDSTRKANARFFSSMDEVPRYAVSMGIRAIMQARKILLLCSGEEKAEILYKALFGPVTPQVPASICQMHRNLYVVADAGALKVIRSKGLI